MCYLIISVGFHQYIFAVVSVRLIANWGRKGLIFIHLSGARTLDTLDIFVFYIQEVMCENRSYLVQLLLLYNVLKTSEFLEM
jgi:hypothetical protein